MRITQVTLREIQLPLRERFVISSGWMDDRRILLLELLDESGAACWSECVAGERPNASPETVDTAWLALERWILPRVLDVALAGPEAVAPLLDEGILGHRMAKAAVEMGAWGLASVLDGVPLARRIGGTREHVAAGISIGIQPSPEALVEKALAAAEMGYAKIKLKIRPGADVPFVDAVRGALGPERPLSVDANAAYELTDADHLARLEDFDLIMLEQPLAAGDLIRHARLQSLVDIPLCLDESIVDVRSVEDMIEIEAGRIVNIKPGRVGGFRSAIGIHDTARAAGVPVWCGGMLESGIGRAYNVALASLPGFEIPGDLSPSRRYWARDVVDPEWTMDGEGRVTVPLDRPGLGVEVDRERIEALTVRASTVRAPVATG